MSEIKSPGPGEEFDPLGAHLSDPYPFYAAARAKESIFFSPKLHAWCVSRYDEVTNILADPETFSSRDVIPRAAGLPAEVDAFYAWFFGEAGALTFTDPPSHTRIRAVAGKGFTPKFAKSFASSIKTIMSSCLDKVAGQPEFDFIQEFAYAAPISVILQVIGIPQEDQEKFLHWNNLVFAVLVGSHQLDEATIVAYGRELFEWRDYVRGLVADRREHPQDDLITFLVNGEVRGHRLSDDEAAAQVMTMLAAGYESTANAMANTVRILLSDRSRWEALLSSTVSVDDVVEECLRLESPVTQLYRTVLRDTSIGGQAISKGDKVCMLWSSVCHDDSYYEQPEEYRPGRSTPVRDIVFGQGIHYCLGAPLVRTELRTMLELLRDRFPTLRLASEDPPEYRSIHHFRALTSLIVTH